MSVDALRRPMAGLVGRIRASLVALLLVGALAAMGTAGCGDGGLPPDDPCGLAADRVEACFGTAADDVFPSGSCNEALAGQVAGMECGEVAAVLMDGKTDSGVDEAVRAAIRESLRDAIVQGMKAALDQVAAALGGDLDQYRAFLGFFSSPDEAAAQAKADELASILREMPELEPRVLLWGDDSWVVNGQCPMSLTTDLAEFVADLVLEHPSLLTELGWAVDKQETDDGYNISVQIGLTLLPMLAEDLPAFGCAAI